MSSKLKRSLSRSLSHSLSRIAINLAVSLRCMLHAVRCTLPGSLLHSQFITQDLPLAHAHAHDTDTDRGRGAGRCRSWCWSCDLVIVKPMGSCGKCQVYELQLQVASCKLLVASCRCRCATGFTAHRQTDRQRRADQLWYNYVHYWQRSQEGGRDSEAGAAGCVWGRVKCACSQVLLVIMLIAFKRQASERESGREREKRSEDAPLLLY